MLLGHPYKLLGDRENMCFLPAHPSPERPMASTEEADILPLCVRGCSHATQDIKLLRSNRDGKIDFSGKSPPSRPRGVPTTKHGESIRALPIRNLRARKPSKLCMKLIGSGI